jgi:hypothetical protein
MVPAAALPDPSEPGVIALGAALGAFFGNTVAQVQGKGPEGRMRRSVDGSYYGTALALIAYLIANASDTSTF